MSKPNPSTNTDATAPQPPMFDDEWDDEYQEDLTCKSCGGTGADPWEGFTPCDDCDGEGYRWWE